jgi:hypothetical protein
LVRSYLSPILAAFHPTALYARDGTAFPPQRVDSIGHHDHSHVDELAVTVVLAAVLFSIPAMPPPVALGVLAVIAYVYILVRAR